MELLVTTRHPGVRFKMLTPLWLPGNLVIPLIPVRDHITKMYFGSFPWHMCIHFLDSSMHLFLQLFDDLFSADTLVEMGAYSGNTFQFQTSISNVLVYSAKLVDRFHKRSHNISYWQWSCLAFMTIIFLLFRLLPPKIEDQIKKASSNSYNLNFKIPNMF